MTPEQKCAFSDWIRPRLQVASNEDGDVVAWVSLWDGGSDEAERFRDVEVTGVQQSALHELDNYIAATQGVVQP